MKQTEAMVVSEQSTTNIDNVADQEFYQDKLYLLNYVKTSLEGKVNAFAQYQLAQNERNIIEHYKARIKSAQSMIDKLQARGLPLTLEAALSQVHDAVGLRIICSFLDDVYLVRDWLLADGDISLVTEKDYIKNPKANGYRSLHLVISLPVPAIKGEASCYAEIQIRTIAMDCWAALEHQLKYKQEIVYQEMLVTELKRCADEMASTDMNLQAIRDMIATDEEKERGGHEITIG